MCGPDIFYLCHDNRTLYIVQVKFVDDISKPGMLKAADTTDWATFYCNRQTGKPLKHYESKHEDIKNAITGLLRNNWKIQQLVVAHTNKKKSYRLNGFDIVTKKGNPNFFDLIHPDMWTRLDFMRQKLMERKSETSGF